MNDERHEPHEADDDVARFFAAEREAVRPDRAGPAEWQRIVEGASTRSARRSWWGPAVGAAAAVAVGVAGWSLHQTTFGQGEVTRGAAVASSTTPTVQRMEQRSATQTSAMQVSGPVDPAFRTWSLSYADQGTIYALGEGRCDGKACPAVIRSSDDGASWRSVHSFAQADMNGSTGDQRPLVQPQGAITEARFASPQVGYVFGGDLWTTRDAGATFTRMSHPGETVLDVEIDGGSKVVVLSADGCTTSGCTGPIYVSQTTTTARTVEGPVASRRLAGRVADAQLVLRDGQVYVQPASGAAGPMRLDGDRLTSLSSPAECAGRPLVSMTSAAGEKDLLYAACEVRQGGGTTQFRLVRSTDDGRTWAAASGELSMPRAGRLSLAATRSNHVVATSGGPRSPRLTVGVQHLQVTADGGRTWTRPLHTAPEDGFDWAASPGAAQVYAVPRTVRGYWHSGDDGRTWEVVDPGVAGGATATAAR